MTLYNSLLSVAARSGSAASEIIRVRPWGTVVCCECCVLSGRDLCFGLITRPEESYRASCVEVQQ